MEELEGSGDNSGIEPLEVNLILSGKLKFYIGVENCLANIEGNCLHSFSQHNSQRCEARKHASF